MKCGCAVPPAKAVVPLTKMSDYGTAQYIEVLHSEAPKS
jgi:hypothetical protein